MRSLLRAAPLLLLLPLLGACSQKPPAPTAEVVAVSRGTIPADPADAAWQGAPFHIAPLLLQDMVEPRLLKASTAEVRVRAITDGTRIAFLLEWADASQDDLPGPARFADACAVQLPAASAGEVPAPQMGEQGKPVQITYWRASWQAVVNGRGDTIKDLYPGAAIDHYPFDAASLEKGSPAQKEMAARYAPARALGNAMAGPRQRPVQDLVAEGPGTLGPAPAGHSDGLGKRTTGGWAVVISRDLPQGLSPGKRSQVAFAVWQGGQQESGSRKMRTGWIPLAIQTTKG